MYSFQRSVACVRGRAAELRGTSSPQSGVDAHATRRRDAARGRLTTPATNATLRRGCAAPPASRRAAQGAPGHAGEVRGTGVRSTAKPRHCAAQVPAVMPASVVAFHTVSEGSVQTWCVPDDVWTCDAHAGGHGALWSPRARLRCCCGCQGQRARGGRREARRSAGRSTVALLSAQHAPSRREPPTTMQTPMTPRHLQQHARCAPRLSVTHAPLIRSVR